MNKQEHDTQTYDSFLACENGQTKRMKWEEVRSEQVFILPLVFRKSCTNGGKRHRERQNNDFHSFFLISIITMPTKRRNEQNCLAKVSLQLSFLKSYQENVLQRRGLSNITNKSLRTRRRDFTLKKRQR